MKGDNKELALAEKPEFESELNQLSEFELMAVGGGHGDVSFH